MIDFEFIEHTADVGVRVYADTSEQLFKNCAEVLFGLILDDRPKPDIEETVVVEAEDIEELLITWLNELLSLFFAYRFLPVDYDIILEEREDYKVIKSRIKGANFDPYQNKIKMEIKAATYHDLKVEKNDSGWIAEVIFDV
ncbi:MAG: archease [Candidatus Omnitrophica bacterium]|nr:archease [Candidatus Omnitrophota bacterium]MBU2251175.1 archease [Candidatus Omnitrophota bacterium]